MLGCHHPVLLQHLPDQCMKRAAVAARRATPLLPCQDTSSIVPRAREGALSRGEIQYGLPLKKKSQPCVIGTMAEITDCQGKRCFDWGPQERNIKQKSLNS